MKYVPVFILLINFVLLGCAIKKQEKFHIGFSQCVSNDRWRQAMHREMRSELFFYRDQLELEISDAEGDNQKQIAQIEAFIEKGVDLLMVSPNESAPITPVVEKAFNYGIPVIVLDRRITSNQFTAYIGADNDEIGQIAGKYISGLLDDHDTIAEIWGLRGSSPAIYRSEGFHEALADKNIEIVEIYSDWTRENAKSAVREHHEEIKNAKVLFAHNDEMAFGAYTVFQESGMNNKCKFIGVDGLAGTGGGIQFVTDNILDATFLYPTGGEEAIRIAYNILNNLPYEKENTLQTTVIDSSNVRIMKLQTDEILSQQNQIERQQIKLEEQIRLYNNQRLAMYSLLAFLTLSIMLGAYALYSLKEKRAANRILENKNRQISEQKEEIQRMAVKAEEATDAKFRFFTNISHEFRTPLTLIIGHLEGLLNHKRILMEADILHDLTQIKKNAYRLLRLINQLMAFRKIENNKLQLQVSEHNIVEFVKDIKDGFDALALKKNIDFKLTATEKNIPVWFDANWLDKVLFNLLSNAFKFTQEAGYIHVKISKHPEDDMVQLEMTDNGRGMSREHVQHAFDRFYSGTEYSDMGTGLGLSLSRELIQLHKGEILLESQKNAGTTFTIKLKLGKAHFDESEIAPEDIIYVPSADQHELLMEFESNGSAKNQIFNGDARTLLIIEDNGDLANFLLINLRSNYNVLIAPDGEEGIKVAVDQVPDLIICDIQIPKKDGLVVTRSVKSDSRTSHIPVILLTAKTQEEQKLEGIKSGAEAYITKPFDMEFLKENINTILVNRDALKSHYQSNAYGLDHDDDNLLVQKDPDAIFIRRFQSLVHQHLGDPEFGVQDICKELGFSRIQLYRKVKALLDASVNDYINTMRLKKSVHLLRTSNLNISEIAFKVGFSSPTYFSTAFKTHYKISPSDLRKE